METAPKYFLGVRLDLCGLHEAIEISRRFLISQKQNKVYTPNPEMIVKAGKDNFFIDVLNRSDLNLCDGFGLHLASGAPRVTGVDYMIELSRIASEQGISVYLLGSGFSDVAAKTAVGLKKILPNLQIAGFHPGSEISELSDNNFALSVNGILNKKIIEDVNASQAKILFVAFGMGKQEKWIDEFLPQMPSVKIAVGVGGAFDFISGTIKRAPLFLREIGLEWLYRLVRQPARIMRIISATIIFSFIVLKDKFYDRKN